MITIKYDIYHNDYNWQTNLNKSFPTLDDFGDWMLDHATPYTDFKFLHVDCVDDYKRCGKVGKLESRNYDSDEDYWVYLVTNDDGIIYSNGKYTHGKNHVSKAMLEFLRKLEDRYINGDDYVFVE